MFMKLEAPVEIAGSYILTKDGTKEPLQPLFKDVTETIGDFYNKIRLGFETVNHI